MNAEKPLLLRHKGFLGLIVTQFLGAMNDNAFKIMLTLYLADLVVKPELGSRYVSLASALFIIPFLLFSTHAGYLADKLSKRTVAIGSKAGEVLIMVLGFFALYSQNLWFLMGVLFLMALQSTFFGPAKYGILPEMLEERDLSNGNGQIQLFTFAAIILGTVLGGLMLNMTKPHVHWASLVYVLMGLLGLASSFFITRVPAAGTKEKLALNPVSKFISNIKDLNKPLFLCVMGIGAFWLFGAMFHIDLLLYGKNLMEVSDTAIGIYLALMAIGIGAGSVLAGKLSGGKVELGLVPIGCVGMGMSSLDLAFAYESSLRVSIDLFLTGFFAGFFIIPLNAFLQARSPKNAKGKTMATANVVSFLGVLTASVLAWVLTDIVKLDAAKTLGVLALMTFGASVYIVWFLRVAFMRFVIWALTHTLYKVKLLGHNNRPLQGPALLVCNHVAYVDPLLIVSCLTRNVRFFMWRPIYEMKLFHWFFKMMNMIPISHADSPKKLMASMQEARQALQNGEVVCIFAEGALTRTGQTLGFQKGIEIVAKGANAPIIPVHLDRVWGSIFSFYDKQYVWKLPRQIPYPVTVSFGKSLPSTAKVHEVRQAVMDLSAESFPHRFEGMHTLHHTFMRQAKKQWFSTAMSDSTGLSLTYGKAVTGAVTLAHKFRQVMPEGERVGVLFPPSVAGALVNIALPMAGLTPVNLNFTLPRDVNDAICEKAGITKIITSEKVLKGLKWDKNDKTVLIEDINNMPGTGGFLDYLCFWLLPVSWIETMFLSKTQKSLDDTATLLFTSGSTGVPKGVALTHANIQSNVQGLIELFQLDKRNVLMGVMPFFHCFGFTGSIWFPLLGGFSVVYHRSPLEPVAIQKMIKQHKATVAMATPTFLQMWMKKFQKEDVESLRFVVTGAEKLRDHVADEFQEKLNVPILEGYGCTELSPVACISVLDVTQGRVAESGKRQGSVGRPLPGVSLKIVDPDTRVIKPVNEPGMLLVKGPNVMKGYWQDPEKTKEVIQDGWYVTGDIAKIDDQGFVHITDRLSRFSKIGGEMVPHIMVEEKIYEAAQSPDARFLVMSVPDEKKGEALAVLYHNYENNIDELVEKLKQSGMPNLWAPDPRRFIKLDEWPTLGTGKVDMSKAKQKLAKNSIIGL